MTTLLVDGNNILVRAVHAAYNARLSVGDTNTGPLVIFINTLAKYVRLEKPTRVLVAWDHPGPENWRLAFLATYKAQRKAASADSTRELRETNFGLAKEFCAAAGVPQVSQLGFEADDLIASAWHDVTPEQSDRIVILSNDSDFMQLVGPNPQGVPCEQVRLSSGSGSSRADTDRWDDARVRTGLKEGPVPSPAVLGALKALQGDTSDNVPGIKGVGPVRAYKILSEQDWDIEKVIAARPDDAELIRRNMILVDLHFPKVPVRIPKWDPTTPASLAFPALRDFLTRYRMRTALDLVETGALWAEDDGDERLTGIGFRFAPVE